MPSVGEKVVALLVTFTFAHLASARPYSTISASADDAYGPPIINHPQPEQSKQQTQGNSQTTTGGYSNFQQQSQVSQISSTYTMPTNQISHAAPAQLYGQPAIAFGDGLSLVQSPLISSLPAAPNGIFKSLSPSSPDMFYFSPRDQVLYRVSRVPLNGSGGNALGGGLSNDGLTSGESATTPSPASTTTPSSIIPPENNNTSAAGPGYGIEFEIEEETGGDYVGGFGATENRNPSLPSSAAPVASGPGAGSGGSSSLGSTGSESAEGSDLLNQLIQNALDSQSFNDFSTFQPDDQSSGGLIDGGYSSGGYSSRTPSGLYGAPTEQLSTFVLPPNATLRLSPQLARYFQQLQQQRGQSQRNTIVPSSTLPENLDAATGTPGGQRRRQRKRMNFKAGGAIG